MPIYTVPEAVFWLVDHGMPIGEKGLRQAIHRDDLRHIRMGSVYVISEEDLQHFLENPPKLGRPRSRPEKD